jgi:hypothetical protein
MSHTYLIQTREMCCVISEVFVTRFVEAVNNRVIANW